MTRDTEKNVKADTAQDKRGTSFDRQQKIMQMFCDNARAYMQLSGAALALTLTFSHQILHIPEDQNVANGWMVTMWICFLAAIVLGAFYQYLAVKYLESLLDSNFYRGAAWLQAGTVYGIMLAAFYGGAVIFTVYAIVRLTQTHGH